MIGKWKTKETRVSVYAICTNTADACKRRSCSCLVFTRMRSSRFAFSSFAQMNESIKNKMCKYCTVRVLYIECHYLGPFTSRRRHSWKLSVGRPTQRISFFSFARMFIAIKTFNASYTRRRMFFWSYYECTVQYRV